MGIRTAVMRGRGPHAFASIAAIVTFVAAAASWGEPTARAPVSLRLPDCVAQPFAYAEFTGVLREQLARDGVPWVGQAGEPAAAGPWTLELQGACGRDAPSVSMQVRSPTGVQLQRDVPLSDIPFDVRARSLAFVAAELVRAAYYREQSAASAAPPPSSQPPLAASPSALPAPSSFPAAAYVPPPATSASAHSVPAFLPPPSSSARGAWQSSTVVGLAAHMRIFSSPTTWSAGARAQVRSRAFACGADWLTASGSESTGSVRGDVVAGWLQLILWQRRSNAWWIGAGPRTSFGLAMASGTPEQGARAASAREPYIDGALQLDGRWNWGSPWGIAFGADTGVARGLFATSDGRRTLALGGWFAGLRLGLDGGF